VIGHLLGDFELAAVAQIFSDTSRAEGVATDLRLDAGVGRAPTDHAVHVGLAHRAASEDTRLAFCHAALNEENAESLLSIGSLFVVIFFLYEKRRIL